MRTARGVFRAVVLLALVAPALLRGAERLSKDGGEWHDSATWQSGKVPPGDSDTLRIYATADLTLTKGSVSAFYYYASSPKEPVQLRIAPMAHLGVLKRLTNRHYRGVPFSVNVSGSLDVQGGAFFYGPASLIVDGGYVFGIGRSWYFTSYADKTPTIHIRHGGMLCVRRIYLRGSAIHIDGGDARFNGLDFGTNARITVRRGTLATEEFTGAARARIVLGEHGQLALKGKVDKDNLQQLYPDLRVYDGDGIRPVESLSFRPGSGSLSDFTCLSLSQGASPRRPAADQPTPATAPADGEGD